MAKASYKILPEFELIIETYVGKFFPSEYERMKKDEFADPQFNMNYNTLVDIRKVEIDFNGAIIEDNVSLMSEFLKINKEQIGKRKCAIFTSKPEQVVGSIFFSDYIKTLPITVGAYSTLDGALEWLNIKDRQSIMQELNNL